MGSHFGSILTGLGGLASSLLGEDDEKPRRRAGQPKPEDAARMEDAGATGYTAGDVTQTAQAAAEGALKQDKLGSTLDELAMFFGSIGNNPQAVAIAHARKQQRIAEAVNAAETHSLAVLGRQKIEEERKERFGKALDDMMGRFIQSAPDADQTLLMELAVPAADAASRGDVIGAQQAIERAGIHLDRVGAIQRGEEAKVVGEEQGEQFVAPFKQEREADAAATKETATNTAKAASLMGDLGRAQATVAGNTAAAQAGGRVAGKLGAYAKPGALDLQTKITEAQTSPSRGGGGGGKASPAALGGSWLEKTRKELQMAGKRGKAFRDETGLTPRDDRDGEERKKWEEANPSPVPRLAAERAGELLSSGQKNLTPEAVTLLDPYLGSADRLQFRKAVALKAADLKNKNLPGGQELIDALVALSGSTAVER